MTKNTSFIKFISFYHYKNGINSEKEKINRIVSEYKENQEQLIELKLEQSLKDKQKELASKFNEEETNTLIKINKL